MAELIGSTLAIIVGNDYGTYHEVALHKLVAKSQYILIIGNTKVGTYLVFLYVLGTDHNDNFQLVA